jgi:serine/threonine protein kinase
MTFRTPTYMSPAQLHRHPAKEGYVGTAVDVWAAGVLLSVMLLGKPHSITKA